MQERRPARASRPREYTYVYRRLRPTTIFTLKDITMLRIRFRPAILLAIISLAACSPEVVLPEPATVAGTAGEYQATRFETFPGSNPSVDVLASGGAFYLSLRLDGTASATLRLPEGAFPGEPAREASLAGRWTIENRDQVRLELDGDATPAAGPYLARGGQLLEAGTVGTTGFEIVLDRR